MNSRRVSLLISVAWSSISSAQHVISRIVLGDRVHILRRLPALVNFVESVSGHRPMKSILRFTSRSMPLAALVAALTLSAYAARDERAPASALTKSDRSVVAEARAQNMEQIALVIAAREGQMAAVAQVLTALGATIRHRDESVDYLSVMVPLGRVEEAIRVPGIAVVNVDATHNRQLSPEPTFVLSSGSTADDP